MSYSGCILKGIIPVQYKIDDMSAGPKAGIGRRRTRRGLDRPPGPHVPTRPHAACDVNDGLILGGHQLGIEMPSRNLIFSFVE